MQQEEGLIPNSAAKFVDRPALVDMVDVVGVP
jgi:hypothetical protein